MKITHKSVYNIYIENVFENVNSYTEMNNAIVKYGGKDTNSEKYRKRTGSSFEVFNQFWMLKFGKQADIGVDNIIDTSYDEFNEGYDFSFVDNVGLPGIIQTKWRNYEAAVYNNISKYKLDCVFKANDMRTNDQKFGDLRLSLLDSSNKQLNSRHNILFINFDENEKLFSFDYEKRPRYVIDRKKQEFYIKSDPNFWQDFLKLIRNSSVTLFEDPPTPRDVQNWITNGVIKEETHLSVTKEVCYLGTKAVINKEVSKGRIEAITATGKTLNIFIDTNNFFEANRYLGIIVIPWRPLIIQTFLEFYKWKMFGHTDVNGVIVNSDIMPILAMSGDSPRYNKNIIGEVFQTTNIDKIAGKILNNYNQNKKTILFITKDSYTNEYDDKVINEDNYQDYLSLANIKDLMNFESLFAILSKNNFGPDKIFEIYDEFHNIIPSVANNFKNSKNREELEIFAKRLLLDMSNRNSGTLFYSASNKSGSIIDSFNVNQFGPLLCKVTRNDLAKRGYVCPRLIFKIIRVNSEVYNQEAARNAAIEGLDLRKAYNEASSVVIAFNDLKKYNLLPNLITFGSHVAGCKFIATDENFKTTFAIPNNVNLHFMSADTKNSIRQQTIDTIKISGNNILNQHSVAQEGVNIPNLNGGLIDRAMGFKDIQQSMGRTDRTLAIDTLNFQKGLISLDSPVGWLKYYNIIYLEINDNINMRDRLINVIRYLRENEIPRDQWEFTYVDDSSRVNPKEDINYFQTSGVTKFELDILQNTINSCDLEVLEELEIEDKRQFKNIVNNAKTFSEKIGLLIDEDMSDVTEEINKRKSSKTIDQLFDASMEGVFEDVTTNKINSDISNIRLISDEIDLGSFVMHYKFGEGVIISIDGDNAIINFGGVDKKISLKYAPITIL